MNDPDSTGREPASAGEASPKPLRTVLIAEDDPDLRATMREVLRIEGYETVEAEDGQTALEILSGGPVDVLILDLRMPGLDGVSLLQRIDPPPPMVIIHSAFEFYSPDEVRELVGSKVFRALRKPTPVPELLSAISEAIAAIESLEE